MAAQALDRATAEEIVQDVFLAVWQNASSYDPARGPVRPWLLQIGHFRIANELRRRSRRPKTEADSEEALSSLSDP
ncbi:MAG TPA: sigma factor, partial [Thermoanaerobaculia bacterium]